MHDKSNKFICPLADFFTTGHDMKTIASYFQIIKDNLQKFISRRYFQFSPIIVTDFSWALINAVIRSFNNTTFSVYINWCSNILIDKQIFKVNFIPTIIFLCYSHFIKMIAKKINKKLTIKFIKSHYTQLLFCKDQLTWKILVKSNQESQNEY